MLQRRPIIKAPRRSQRGQYLLDLNVVDCESERKGLTGAPVTSVHRTLDIVWGHERERMLWVAVGYQPLKYCVNARWRRLMGARTGAVSSRRVQRIGIGRRDRGVKVLADPGIQRSGRYLSGGAR